MWNGRCWIVLLLVAYSRSVRGDYRYDILRDSVETAATALREYLRNCWPSLGGIADATKQWIAGYPFEFLANCVNSICSSGMSSKLIKSKMVPNVHLMNFQLRTSCTRHNYPLLEAKSMWQNPEFNISKNVVILITGWATTINNTNAVDTLANAYNCRGDVNFVAVDVSGFVDTLYTWAALNTEDIGRHIAKGLVHLTAVVPVENIHLIGHSLGAHIMGAAGRHFNALTNETISRITGLDPAKPCFNEGENLSGLMRGDAKFIDVIHSNSGVLGKREPMGDVDFYPGGMAPLRPGCLSLSCSHARAWEYYAESVYPGNENNFPSKRCNSMYRLRAGNCAGEDHPMGYATPDTLKGTFFLEVNRAAPYGENGKDENFKKNQLCGRCPTNLK